MVVVIIRVGKVLAWPHVESKILKTTTITTITTTI